MIGVTTGLDFDQALIDQNQLGFSSLLKMTDVADNNSFRLR